MSDQLHHKKRRKKEADLLRKTRQRESMPVILIVCEGQSTEPQYLKSFREDKGLNKANIEIVPGNICGTNPKSMIEYAKEKHNREDYDRIYCVFDKEHANHNKVVEEIKKQNSFYGIISCPCFEYWILLHFEYSTSPYYASGQKTPADQIISYITKKHIKNYHKSKMNIYEVTKKHLKKAIENNKKLQKQQKNNFDNPSANMYELIEYLESLV